MKKTIYVYIAGPYTQGDVGQNVRNAIYSADAFANWPGSPNFAVYVPHLSHLYHLIKPHSHEWWLDFDLAWLDKCDCLLRLPGNSIGADNEVSHAKFIGIPVFYSEKELFDWATGASAE